MKVLQTIGGFSAKCGGTSTCTYDLLLAMHSLNPEPIVDILTPEVSTFGDKLMGEGEYWIRTVPNDYKTPLCFSSNMKTFLRNSDYDIYHTNGMWMHINHITCLEARKKNKPYIITPHGMLYPQALKRSAWKKNILLSIGGVSKDLTMASCIHATCKEEMLHYRALGYKNPVAVIPNPVPIPDFLQRIHHDNNIKRIGFLGRLHPRKNVEALIDAWILLATKVKDAELLIMGKGDREYEQLLKNKVHQYNLHNVIFAGFVTGREKFEKLASLTALCVPSDFENFGMIVTEALSVGTPVIASSGTPWQELNTNQCGYWINNDVHTIADTIEKIFELQGSELTQMGINGRQLVERKYKDTQVALKMKQLYEWILNRGEKPEFVYD